MGDKDKVTLNGENTEVHIEDLTISNPDLYNFLRDKENIDDWVKKALMIGCVGLRQMVLTENVDFVEKEFNKFISKTKEMLEKETKNINETIETTFSLSNTQSPIFQMKELMGIYFDKDKGQIKDIIDDTFNIDNKKSALSRLVEELRQNSKMDDEKLKELLDSNKTDSPARQLKEQILERLDDVRDKEIKDIRDQVMKQEAIELEKQRGTSKGFEFEAEVHTTLQTLASHYEDSVSPVGEKSGTGSKKGDILIELENKKKIIVECKDSSSYSSRKTIDEINEAVKNRNASFGIFVFAKRDEMPKDLCPIKITDKYLITYYDEDNLYFAYRLARLLILRGDNTPESEVNFEKISSELNAIEDNFRTIDTMQARATSVINSGEFIKSNLKNIRDNLEENVDKMKRTLGENYDSNSSVEE